MPETKTGCRKCGGTLIRDDGEIKCINCGMPARSPVDVARFYDQHREEILADLARLPTRDVLKKWNIASGTMSGVLRRWRQAGLAPEVTEGRMSRIHFIPHLPDWSEEWTDAVKIEWFKCWLYLITISERRARKDGKDDKARG